jgi:hypothetical protein
MLNESGSCCVLGFVLTLTNLFPWFTMIGSFSFGVVIVNYKLIS